MDPVDAAREREEQARDDLLRAREAVGTEAEFYRQALLAYEAAIQARRLAEESDATGH